MTDVYFSFDTEDFTSDHASDAIRDEANILHEYGIKGNFNIVGYLARELVRNKRQDVLDALKQHVVSFHSLRHTYHPTICEYTDLEDYQEARKKLDLLESEGMGMVKAATGVDSFAAAVPPGMSASYVAMYAYADWGIPMYFGSFFMNSKFVYFCNALHANYDFGLESYLFDTEFDTAAFLDEMAKLPHCVLYNHPNRVLYREFWDMYNYNKVNMFPMHQWAEAPRYTEEETATYYANLRKLIQAIQADERFVISDTKTLAEKAVADMNGRTVKKDMLPAILAQLKKEFSWIKEPVSLSLCDCFYAAKHFMDSDEPYHPGKVHGFLYEPAGTEEKIELTADEIRKAAAMTDPDEFMPASFEINGKKFGPADLLFAMLEAAMGAETAWVEPKKQQCHYQEEFPLLQDFDLEHSWLHSDDFKDQYLTDRFRLQAWTIRVED